MTEYGTQMACMDGSVPAYYIKTNETPDDQKRRWVIYFDDGPICFDKESCDAMVSASPKHSSSVWWPEKRDFGGIFDNTSENSMANANKVFVPYCTGDGWLSAFMKMG